jgi:hypothetical protein
MAIGKIAACASEQLDANAAVAGAALQGTAVVDKPYPDSSGPDLIEKVKRIRIQVRRDAVRSVIDAVESYQTELPKSGAGHEGRILSSPASKSCRARKRARATAARLPYRPTSDVAAAATSPSPRDTHHYTKEVTTPRRPRLIVRRPIRTEPNQSRK